MANQTTRPQDCGQRPRVIFIDLSSWLYISIRDNMETWKEISDELLDCHMELTNEYMINTQRLRWPTSTILVLYAHCCSAKLFFFSAENFAALPSTFRLCRAVFLLCQALFSYSERFFGSAKQFGVLPNPFRSVTIFPLCWACLSSVKHFSAMLSIFRLYQAFFFYTEQFIHSATHFSSMLNIFLPYQAFSSMLSVFVLRCQAFVGYAEPFSVLPDTFLLCRAVHSRAEKYTAEQKNHVA